MRCVALSWLATIPFRFFASTLHHDKSTYDLTAPSWNPHDLSTAVQERSERVHLPPMYKL